MSISISKGNLLLQDDIFHQAEDSDERRTSIKRCFLESNSLKTNAHKGFFPGLSFIRKMDQSKPLNNQQNVLGPGMGVAEGMSISQGH